jgi:hypothetical protein
MKSESRFGLRAELPTILAFVLILIGLTPVALREGQMFVLASFFAFGAYTELSSKKDSEKKRIPTGLFSGTTFIVPICVPITLAWTFIQRTLDGQVFTQNFIGLSGCVISLGMIGFFLRRRLSDTLRVATGVILFSGVIATVYWNSRYLFDAYELQRHFNESSDEMMRAVEETPH